MAGQLIVQEYTYWSPVHGMDVTRLSTAPEGKEYHITIPRTEGRQWRSDRQDALSQLEAAVSLKLEPGRVSARR